MRITEHSGGSLLTTKQICYLSNDRAILPYCAQTFNIEALQMSQYYSQTFLSGQLLNTQEQNLLTNDADDHVSNDWWTPDDDKNPNGDVSDDWWTPNPITK